MRLIGQDDMNRAQHILTTTFKNNPGVLWVVKQDGRIQDRIAVLCKFCLSVAYQKKGAYISSDNNGVALLFKSDARQKPLAWLTGYIILGQHCIGWNRAWEIIQREREIIRRRPKNPYLYFWMLGAVKNEHGLQTIKEIKNFAFNLSKQMKLPIYAETTLPQMVKIYARYGFRKYDEWDTGKNGLKIYFISRDWHE